MVAWLMQPGDMFKKGDPLCQVETEKVSAVYEAPMDGQLLEVTVNAGDVVAVGEVLCRIDTGFDEP